MNSDSRENYLINILRLTNGEKIVKTTELSKYMNVAPASVTEMLKTLNEEGYVEYRRYKGVSLTEKGISAAKNLRRKHHIMERFLTDIMDENHEIAHEGACVFEHAMTDSVASKMCRMVGTKVDSDCDTCPNPCDDKRGIMAISSTIASMNVGEIGTISHIASDDVSLVKKLVSMGFVPGRKIRLSSKLSDKGVRIIKIGNAAIALDFPSSSAIYVEVSQ